MGVSARCAPCERFVAGHEWWSCVACAFFSCFVSRMFSSCDSFQFKSFVPVWVVSCHCRLRAAAAGLFPDLEDRETTPGIGAKLFLFRLHHVVVQREPLSEMAS